MYFHFAFSSEFDSKCPKGYIEHEFLYGRYYMKKQQVGRVLIVGAGLAGSDAAYFLATHGVEVILVESKGIQKNPAQKLTTFSELVCTNSLKSRAPESAHGLLKTNMKSLGSLVLSAAELTQVPAGQALAVDREKFSNLITEKLKSHPLIQTLDLNVANPVDLAREYNCSQVIIASGPLTNQGLVQWIEKEITQEDLYFYDSIAPVVDFDSLDLKQMFFKDRYGEVSRQADYLNVPLDKDQYEAFVTDLVEAEKVPPQKFEKMKYFESCLPIDLMAERGPDTLRFSCMKPVGLEDKEGKRAYAVIQLRKENLRGSAYNMVGFQNRLTYGEQVRVFKKLPGFEKAIFNHLGSVHRNTFINSKTLLNWDMSSKKHPQVYFAGQITGVEGYTESAASGLYVAFQVLRKLKGLPGFKFSEDTGLGALIHYLMTAEKPVPSNINFGLFEALPKKVLKKEYGKNWRDYKKKNIVFKNNLNLNIIKSELENLR
jgi:methylenetetrahydrofolate--tRNA-(uracil-5-)-methyltransferase